MNVLIVDDSKAMRLIVKRTLRQAGLGDLTVHEAGNGKEALEQISSVHPELVLSDLNMPEMNGLELLRAVRGSGNNVKFGLVTSEGSAEIRAEALEAGANFMVVKPFTPDGFKQAISSDGDGLGAVQGHAVSGAGELPSIDVLEKTVDMLVGPKVKMEKGKLTRPDGRRPGALVTYGADDGSIEVVASFELDIVIAGACALTGLPANTVSEHRNATISAKALPDGVKENANEFFNVFGSVFVGEKPGSGKLREVVVPATGFPDNILKMIRKPKARVDVAAEVEGYGKGGFSLFRIE